MQPGSAAKAGSGAGNSGKMHPFCGPPPKFRPDPAVLLDASLLATYGHEA